MRLALECFDFSQSCVPTPPPVEESDGLPPEPFDDADMLLDTFLDDLADSLAGKDAPLSVFPALELLPETTTLAPVTDAASPQAPQARKTPRVLPSEQGTVFAALRRHECLYSGCGKKFNRHEHLKKHIEAVHHKKKEFRCRVCPKAFTTGSALAVHMRVHSDERPFACPHPGCGKRFRQKMHMNRHTRVHTGEKPFACPVCNKTFNQASSMKRHIHIVHEKLLGA